MARRPYGSWPLCLALGWVLAAPGCGPAPVAPEAAWRLGVAPASVVVRVVPSTAARRLSAAIDPAWDQVRVTLKEPAPGSAQWSATANADVDAPTGRRAAQVRLAGVPPGTGYTARIELLARRAGGSLGVVVASLDRSAIDLASGENQLDIADAPVWQAGLRADAPGAFETFVTSFPPSGTPCRFNNAVDVLAVASGEVYYLDTNALHAIRPDANGRLASITVAGSVAGLRDGAGSDALFTRPGGLIASPDGSLIVADTGNHMLREVRWQADGSARVTTLAGTGEAGSDDGTGATARFHTPMGLAWGTDSALYVADSQNHRIRRVRRDGAGRVQVETIAGTGASGFQDGAGAAAMFNTPQAIAALPGGDLLVGDTDSPRVRRLHVDPAGAIQVSTVAGTGRLGPAADGPPLATALGRIAALVASRAGEILIGDGRVRRLSGLDGPAPTLTTIAGGGTNFAQDGPALASGFQGGIKGLSEGPEGQLFVATPRMIRRLHPDPEGNLVATRFAGFADDGDLYTADGHLDGSVFQPESVVVDLNGDLLVATTASQIVRLRGPDFAALPEVIAGDGEAGHVDGAALAARFRTLKGMALDAEGRLYVADFGNHCIRRLERAGSGFGAVSTVAGLPGIRGSTDGDLASATFANPIDLTFDADGSLVVADAGNKLIRRVRQAGLGAGSVTTVAGRPQSGPGGLHADGPGIAALFRSPIGMDFDTHGDLFVADGDGIRRVAFAADGSTTVSTLGTAGTSVDGALSSAAFTSVSDVLVDGDNALLVTDGARIRRIELGAAGQGFVRTLVGSVAGFADGPGSVALGSVFADLARGPGREIYAVDYYNRLIRRVRRL